MKTDKPPAINPDWDGHGTRRPEGFTDRLEEKKPPTTPPPTPKPVLYLPVDGLTKINECAEECFKGMAASGEYFLRDGVLVKPRQSDTQGLILNVISNDELPSQLEYVFEVEKKFYSQVGVQSRPVNCSPKDAKSILNSPDEMRKHSLPLRLLAENPVIIERGGKPVVLQQGYHRDVSGIYVIHSLGVPAMTLEEAKELLLDLFADYLFVSPSDQSRANRPDFKSRAKTREPTPGCGFSARRRFSRSIARR
jgi:hypothetical protein